MKSVPIDRPALTGDQAGMPVASDVMRIDLLSLAVDKNVATIERKQFQGRTQGLLKLGARDHGPFREPGHRAVEWDEINH